MKTLNGQSERNEWKIAAKEKNNMKQLTTIDEPDKGAIKRAGRRDGKKIEEKDEEEEQKAEEGACR